MKKSLLVIIILFSFAFCFYGGNNNTCADAAGIFNSSDPLLGKWVNYETESSIVLDKGGYGLFNGLIISWEAKNGVLIFKADEPIYTVDEHYAYTVNGDLLTLISNDLPDQPDHFLRDDDYTGPDYNPLVGNWVGQEGSIVFNNGTGMLRGETFNWFGDDYRIKISSYSLGLDDTIKYVVAGDSLILLDNGCFYRDGRVDTRIPRKTIDKDHFLNIMSTLGLNTRDDYTLNEIGLEYSISPEDINDIGICSDSFDNTGILISFKTEDLARAIYKLLAGHLACDLSYYDATITASSGENTNKLTIDSQRYSEFDIISRVGNTLILFYGENYYSSLTFASVNSLLSSVGY